MNDVLLTLTILNVMFVMLNVKLYTEIMKEKCQTVRKTQPRQDTEEIKS